MRIHPLAAFTPCLIALSLVGCPSKDKDEPSESQPLDDSVPFGDDTYEDPVDADEDGVTEADGDCDDSNPDIYTGHTEDCDGIDNNCNGLIDEGLTDTDGDAIADCLDVEDCDGIDNDGDGYIDEDFADSDGNGEADCVGTEACDGIDNDGDGDIDEGYDVDGDGYSQCATSSSEEDCDDSTAATNPGAAEVEGDAVDNDCDGIADEGSWARGDLVITEIMSNPLATSDAYGEWFEIYNVSDRTLSLNGLTILTADSSHQIDSDDVLTVAPGAFFVLGKDDNSADNGDVEIGYEYEDISLANEDDVLSLLAGTVTIDTVIWDDGDSMPDEQGSSMMTDQGIYSASLNDSPLIWCAARDPWGFENGDKGSPGELNELCSTVDHDEDGYTGDEGDCDDANDTVYPGAYESDPDVDNDCDGVAEEAPTADAQVTGSEHLSCSDIQLDGTGSFDPQGSALTYDWSLVTAPSRSIRTTADITLTTDAQPSFNPDIPGSYMFSLTVNDGGVDSLPSMVTVVIEEREYNSDPSANAGTDQTGSGSSRCTPVSYGVSYDCEECSSSTYSLSASGSTDADGDTMLYAWEVTSGETYGALSAATGETNTLTISGVTGAYPTAASQAVDVMVTATDCMGGTGRDTVTVTLTCTGSP